MTRPTGGPGALSLAGLRADPNLRFPARPRIVDDLRVFEMPDGLGVLVHAGDAPVVLRGRLAEASFAFLRDCLDGSLDLDALALAAPVDLPLATVRKTLWLLHTKGLLVDGPPHDGPALTWRAPPDPVLQRQLLFWGRHVGLTRAAGSATEVQRRLGHARVVVVGAGLFGAAAVDLLARSGCGELRVLSWDAGAESSAIAAGVDALAPTVFATAGPSTIDAAETVLADWAVDADLIVTATRNAADQLFDVINRLSQRTAVPWLRGNIEASALEIGPYVHPRTSACFTCLRLRRRSSDPLAVEHELDHAARAAASGGTGTPPLGESLFGATLGASLLVGEVVRVTTGIAMPSLLDRVLTISPITGEQRSSRVLRMPRCPDCSRAAAPVRELPEKRPDARRR